MFEGECIYQTIVKADVERVWELFQNPKYLEVLTAFPKINVLSGEHTAQNEVIHLSIDIGIQKMDWAAEIVEVKHPYLFVDKGIQMPFPFTYWKHEHSFQNWGEFTGITDRVNFSCKLPAFLMKSILKKMFQARAHAIKTQFK
ncbi:hypothetical protein [Alteribacillus sp. YIM 98480]|uniref:SRPBCC family protein n=1 Tax=Alteribacillus sp. YIM 98480 TaxID=2606599 RepID=UPI00131D446F|nr:hypothetical protein [Alteribacillus sp. YIM 98480]